jgi:hypothetical protein
MTMPEPTDDKQQQQTPGQQEGEEFDFWKDAVVISTYTRAQALGDGFLVDVSELAREAGFKLPVAITQALWTDIESIPERDKGIQDVTGRLWDVLFMGAHAIRREVAQGGGDSDRVDYQLILTLQGDAPGEEVLYPVKILIGPGDDGSPVFTILKPHED